MPILQVRSSAFPRVPCATPVLPVVQVFAGGRDPPRCQTAQLWKTREQRYPCFILPPKLHLELSTERSNHTYDAISTRSRFRPHSSALFSAPPLPPPPKPSPEPAISASPSTAPPAPTTPSPTSKASKSDTPRSSPAAASSKSAKAPSAPASPPFIRAAKMRTTPSSAPGSRSTATAK